MDDLFSHLTLADVHRDVIRNIVSIRESQDLFDDLSDRPDEWALAQQVEGQVRPPPYRSGTPVIHRPFEDAQYLTLNRLLAELRRRYPITAVVGHSDIAPGRKTDPGPCFDWHRVHAAGR